MYAIDWFNVNFMQANPQKFIMFMCPSRTHDPFPEIINVSNTEIGVGIILFAQYILVNNLIIEFLTSVVISFMSHI